jgi:hypothetical protein
MVMAALDLGFRANATGRVAWLGLSAVAMMLATGSKLSNLFLLIPWIAVVRDWWMPLLKKPLAAVAIFAVALPVSVLPISLINQTRCGDWTGAVLEFSRPSGSAAVRLPWNVLLLTAQNVVPPVFPLAKAWDGAVDRVVPAGWKPVIRENFEEGGARLFVPELQVEEHAGIGLGVILLVLVPWAVRVFGGWRGGGGKRLEPEALLLGVIPFLALAALMAKANLTTFARIAAPYYLPLLPLLLLPAFWGRAVRAGWWRAGALAAAGVAAALLVVSPARPLWPTEAVLGKAGGGSLVQRARSVYGVYAGRNDALAPIREALPPGTARVAMVTMDDLETSLWKPFGSRRVIHLVPGEDAARVRERGVRWVVLRESALTQFFGETVASWVERMRGRVVRTFSITSKVQVGPEAWHLIELVDAAPDHG